MTKNGWIPCKLNELGFVGRGKSRHRPRNAPELYGGPYPFVQTADIMGSEFYISSYSQTYSEAGLAQSKLWEPNTLCITNAGANTGESAILGIRACFPDSVIAFVADKRKSDVRFVKYYLDTIIEEIRAITGGATQDNLSVEKLLTFDIPTPPVSTQRKIASILSAYDDLIENNSRQIEILEAMAQAIYREWFVNFRFPGHENVKLVQSTLGMIPEGWKVGAIGDICNKNSESVNPSNFAGEYFEHFSLPSFDMNVLPAVEAGNSILSNKTVVTNDSVLISKLNPRIPRIWLPFPSGEKRAISSTEFMVMRGKNGISREFIYSLFRSNDFHDRFSLCSGGTSTSHQRVKPPDFLRLPIVIPPAVLMEGFRSISEALLNLVQNKRVQTQNFRTTRDLLLPKLISGQLDVEDLDIDMGESLVELDEATA